MRPEEIFEGSPVGLAVLERVSEILADPSVEVRTSKSQVAFRRNRGFAYLWRPGQYLRSPTAPAVLSIVLGRRDASSRFKEVVHPAPAHWMHHLEVRAATEIDDEVAGWLLEARDRA